MHLSRDEVNSMKLELILRWHVGVLNNSLLRTVEVVLLLLGYLSSWIGSLLAFGHGIVDFGLVLSRIDTVQQISNIVASTKLLPGVPVDVFVGLWLLFMGLEFLILLVLVLLQLLLQSLSFGIVLWRQEALLLRQVRA